MTIPIASALSTCLLHIESSKKDNDTYAVDAKWRFQEDHPCFQGHFPGNPVLPGIMQLAAVRQSSEICLSCELIPVGYDRVKFKTMVLPGDTLLITLIITLNQNQFDAKFKIQSENGRTISSGKCTFKQPTQFEK